MTKASKPDIEISEAIERLRAALSAREEVIEASPDEAALADRIGELERDNARLTEELRNLQQKRDKDVAALDELIAQLKPLIEEV